MPETVTVKIHGLDELQRNLERIPREVSKKILRRALRKAAKVVREAIVNFAPKASGFLAEHFNIKFKSRKADIAGSAFIGPDGKIKYPNKQAMRVQDVARYHEFGTSKMAADPFMTRGFEQTKDQALEIIVEEIKKALAEETKK